ncbi:hypothetical protein D9613_010851 [Agrocybe pediades]|uniref:F-box domain-containing protein n=1 Tax=Agrocybe pediades TaxID=84607 RepID=A0A8H4QLK3_9AGAR|nr:hypothetical protein D9613_010851 [Agrocybe pediades]
MLATRRHAPAPISVLHEELLWKIFLLNTYPDFDYHVNDYPLIGSGDRPLTTARQCSQVCRQWRSIYLSSSAIWGRLIDLDGLGQKTNKWRKEVVARTGEASLWVYGVAKPCNVHDFPVPFLRNNWRRVQRLFITVVGDQNSYRQGFPVAFLQNNWRRVQRLFITVISGRDTSRTLLLLDRQPMWAFLEESAPQLESFRSFKGIFDQTYKFPINASWLRNLSSVAFPHTCTPKEILNALRRMPELVSLTVFNPFPNYSEISVHPGYPHIILPKLRMLALRGNPRTVGILLEYIQPSADCSITITRLIDISMAGEDNWEEYEKYEKSLTVHIVPYFSLHPPSTVRLHFISNKWRSALSLESYSAIGSDGLVSDDRRSIIELPFPWSPVIYKLIASASFSRVTTLRIPSSRSGDESASASLLVHLLKFFNSVTTFSANDAVLYCLLQRPEKTSALFPALVTLEVIRLFLKEHNVWGEGVVAEPHEQFLKLRKEIGRPISILDLRPLSQLPRDRDNLEWEHPGLLVRWSRMIANGERRTEEYSCGDGYPEKLRFSSVVEGFEARRN